MKIIDAQLHAWWPNSSERPWAGESLHGPSFTVDQVRSLIDEHGVHGAVLVPPSWTGWDNSYVLDAARKYPERFGVMGLLNVDAADAKAQLTAWRDQPGMLGTRIAFLNDQWLRVLRERAFDWFWETSEKANVPLMCLPPGNLPLLAEKAKNHPGMTIVIDHAGRHPRGAKDEAAWADLDFMCEMAKYPNVSVKVTSLPCFSTEAYPFPSTYAQRLSWGSDFTRLTSTYAENLQLFTEAFDFIEKDDLEWIMGKSIARTLRWPVA